MNSKPKRLRKKKSIWILEDKQAGDGFDDDSYITHQLTESSTVKLETCVPYHLSSNGTLITDKDVGQLCSVNHVVSLDSVPSAHAPSNDGLPLAKISSAPLIQEHDLTIEEIQVGLKNITRTGNGFGINFSELDLSSRCLLDISLVEYFSDLTAIDISNNYIQNIKGFGALPYLKKINASRNEMKMFGDFNAPIALKKINFSRNRISTLVNLNFFWALTEVDLSHNELVFVEEFKECRHLKILDLSHNRISTIKNFQCPSLVVLLLHNNNIEDIINLDGCYNLRTLSLAQNQITTLNPLQNLTQLNELWIQDNQISDLYELENLRCQLNLSSLFIYPNPINSVGLWRRMVIFLLPQLRFLDGHVVEAEESMLAKNTFNPSYEKVAHETRTAIILDRICQAANIMLDHNVNTTFSPPIILLVGAPFSRCNELAGLLKEKYRSKIQLGGVHSTATTLEASTNKDIPVSFETFLHMKGRGEFLATSHILGRACGFTTSQITRASERSSVLVASVPLGVAILLQKWKLKPKIVLVMPMDKLDVSLLSKASSSSMLKESDIDQDVELLSMDTQIWSDIHEEENQRHSIPVVQFAPGETTYDMDEEGEKRPSLLPYDGPGLLRNREESDPSIVHHKNKTLSGTVRRRGTSADLPSNGYVRTFRESQGNSYGSVRSTSTFPKSYLDEYNGEEEYGCEEMYPNKQHSAVPPPSRDSTNATASDIKTDDEISCTESDTDQPKVKHRQNRIEACILNSRQEYIHFNSDNPGFFSAVIDSTDLEYCLNVLTGIVDENLKRMSSGGKKFVNYAHRNQTDSVKFLKHRFNEHKKGIVNDQRNNACRLPYRQQIFVKSQY